VANGDKEITLFFQLLEWLKGTNNDELEDVQEWLLQYPDLDYKKKQLAYDEKQKVKSYFETVIDQPAFSTNDHKRLRKFLIDWYSSHRTYITQTKQGTDPFNMQSEALDEMIKSFGFPYPHKIISSTRKAQFILDLINLYHKKGTPSVLVSALQTYFGLSNVILSEWWIERNAEGTYFAKSLPIYPKGLRDNQLLSTEISYYNFILDDPLWQLTEAELNLLYNTSKITLPSITSHISLQATVSIMGSNTALIILNRKIQESYEYWQATGDLNRDVSLRNITTDVSLLELTLAICYLFNSSTDSNDGNHLYYQGQYAPLDLPDNTGARDDIDDVDYGLIIDEYNNINKRPLTRDERDINLTKRGDRFTGLVAEHSINNIIRDPGPELELINSGFKAEIDSYIANGERDSLLEDFLHDLEYYLMEIINIMGYPISYLTIDAPIEDSLKEVIDFFKPYRTRIRDFLTTLAIDDRLGDSQLEKDAYNDSVNQILREYGYIDELGFNMGLAEDGVSFFITQKLYDSVTDLDNYLHDIFSFSVSQIHELSVSTDDNNMISIYQNLFDREALEDIIKSTITQRLNIDASFFLKDETFQQISHNPINKLTITDGHILLIDQKDLDSFIIRDMCINSVYQMNRDDVNLSMNDTIFQQILHSVANEVNTNDNHSLLINQMLAEINYQGLDYGLVRDYFADIAMSQVIKNDDNVLLNYIFKCSLKQDPVERYGNYILGDSIVISPIGNVAKDNLTHLDRMYPLIKQMPVEHGTFGFDNGLSRDSLIISPISNIMKDSVLNPGLDEYNWDIFSHSVSERFMDNYETDHNMTTSINLLTHNRVLNPELDENSWDDLSYVIAEKIIEDCVAKHDLITSINLPIVEADGTQFDNSLTRDSIHIKETIISTGTIIEYNY